MDNKNKTPEYTRRAIDKYLNKFESKTIRLPKGTTERIKKHSESVNGFINNLVLSELERLEQQTAKATDYQKQIKQEPEEEEPPF
ncbi:MAG: hypothetical protein ACLRZ9_05710 [Eubacterium sp.]